MAKRPCLGSSIHPAGHTLTTGTRCTECQRARNTQRGSTTARGYGPEHQRLRALWTPLVATGTVTCWRCTELIQPNQPWDLGHADHDRTVYRGPEHRACNRATAGRGRGDAS